MGIVFIPYALESRCCALHSVISCEAMTPEGFIAWAAASRLRWDARNCVGCRSYGSYPPNPKSF